MSAPCFFNTGAGIGTDVDITYMYQLGLLSLLRIIFDGICIATYPTRRMDMHVWYWTSVRFKSSSSPLRRALAKLLRSMKLRMKRIIMTGNIRKSIRRTKAFSSFGSHVSTSPPPCDVTDRAMSLDSMSFQFLCDFVEELWFRVRFLVWTARMLVPAIYGRHLCFMRNMQSDMVILGALPATSPPAGSGSSAIGAGDASREDYLHQSIQNSLVDSYRTEKVGK